MNLSEINWDLDEAGAWPLALRIAVVFLTAAVVIGLWFYFDTQPQFVELDSATQKEQELKTTFEQKQKKAVNLDEYKAQLEDIERTFGDLLRQLPDKTQVPDLLVDVSQTGLASGLEFELFRPSAETPKEFYAELPIEIRVVGNYMQFGTFVSGLASLPRIVTIHNVSMSQRAQSAGKPNQLTMSALVKTYRYLEDGGAVTKSKGARK